MFYVSKACQSELLSLKSLISKADVVHQSPYISTSPPGFYLGENGWKRELTTTNVQF